MIIVYHHSLRFKNITPLGKFLNGLVSFENTLCYVFLSDNKEVKLSSNKKINTDMIHYSQIVTKISI
jgi:hypothetical protein